MSASYRRSRRSLKGAALSLLRPTDKKWPGKLDLGHVIALALPNHEHRHAEVKTSLVDRKVISE